MLSAAPASGKSLSSFRASHLAHHRNAPDWMCHSPCRKDPRRGLPSSTLLKTAPPALAPSGAGLRGDGQAIPPVGEETLSRGRAPAEEGYPGRQARGQLRSAAAIPACALTPAALLSKMDRLRQAREPSVRQPVRSPARSQPETQERKMPT